MDINEKWITIDIVSNDSDTEDDCSMNGSSNSAQRLRLQENVNLLLRKKPNVKQSSGQNPSCSKHFNDARKMEATKSFSNASSINFSDECEIILPSDLTKDGECTNGTYKFRINTEKLQEEAVQICNLLPNLNYKGVCAVLRKNWQAENRIELCLWDLLPYKRPPARIPSKRKLEDNSSKELKNNYCEVDLYNQGIYDNKLSSDKSKLTTNEILHPAKLKINSNSSDIKCATAPNCSIFSPSKLSYITVPQQENQSYRQISVKQYKNRGHTNNRNLSPNVFAPKSTIGNSNSSNRHVLDTYMEHLQQMRNTKRETLFGKFGHSNTRMQTNAKEIVNHSKFKNQNADISQSFNNRKGKGSQRMNPFDDTTYKLTNKQANGIRKLQNMPKHNLHRRIHQALNIGIFNVLSIKAALKNSFEVTQISKTSSSADEVIRDKPSTSTASVTTPIGGARRKETISVKNVVLPTEIENVYEQLLIMFPKIDKNDLKRLCLRNSNLIGDIALDDLMQILIEDILTNEDSYAEKKVVKKKNSNDDKQHAYLSGIFPDAESNYLKNVVASMKGDEDALHNFVDAQTKNATYPKKDDKLRKLLLMEQQQQYTRNFNMKQFLKIFPDPFKHFEDPNRQCKYTDDGYNFLQFYFKNIYLADAVLAAYKQYNYDLTATAAYLEKFSPDRLPEKKLHLWTECPLEDIPLLQECAFITHKAQILQYFNTLKENETREFVRLKRTNELLECQCCYDTECMPSKCSTCNDGHIFCNSCIVKGVESVLASGETRVACFTQCSEEIDLSVLQKVLSPSQFNILICKRQEAEVMAAKLEGLVACPFCHFAAILPPEDKVLKCLNPGCMKESCRLCKMVNHVPLKCYEEETDKARLILEEKMTEALIRKCYKCSLPFFKEEGCNKISCSCGALMCYICDKPVASYAHFNEANNPTSTLCPLWSDNKIINATVVEAVGKETLKHLTEKNPNIALNAPDLSSDTNSAGNTILSARVRKVAYFDD